MKKLFLLMAVITLLGLSAAWAWPKATPKPDATGLIEYKRFGVYTLWPGRLLQIKVNPGQSVALDQAVAVVETVRPTAKPPEHWQENWLTAQILYQAAQEQVEQQPQNEQARQALKIAETNLQQIQFITMQGGLENEREQQIITSHQQGVVLQQFCEIGEVLTPGRMILEVGRFDPAWVEVLLTEDQVAQIQPGQMVQGVARAFPDQPIAGTVQEVAQEARLAPHEKGQKLQALFPARIAWPNPQGKLKPGMTIDLWWQS